MCTIVDGLFFASINFWRCCRSHLNRCENDANVKQMNNLVWQGKGLGFSPSQPGKGKRISIQSPFAKMKHNGAMKENKQYVQSPVIQFTCNCSTNKHDISTASTALTSNMGSSFTESFDSNSEGSMVSSSFCAVHESFNEGDHSSSVRGDLQTEVVSLGALNNGIKEFTESNHNMRQLGAGSCQRITGPMSRNNDLDGSFISSISATSSPRSFMQEENEHYGDVAKVGGETLLNGSYTPENDDLCMDKIPRYETDRDVSDYHADGGIRLFQETPPTSSDLTHGRLKGNSHKVSDEDRAADRTKPFTEKPFEICKRNNLLFYNRALSMNDSCDEVDESVRRLEESSASGGILYNSEEEIIEDIGNGYGSFYLSDKDIDGDPEKDFHDENKNCNDFGGAVSKNSSDNPAQVCATSLLTKCRDTAGWNSIRSSRTPSPFFAFSTADSSPSRLRKRIDRGDDDGVDVRIERSQSYDLPTHSSDNTNSKHRRHTYSDVRRTSGECNNGYMTVDSPEERHLSANYESHEDSDTDKHGSGNDLDSSIIQSFPKLLSSIKSNCQAVRDSPFRKVRRTIAKAPHTISHPKRNKSNKQTRHRRGKSHELDFDICGAISNSPWRLSGGLGLLSDFSSGPSSSQSLFSADKDGDCGSDKLQHHAKLQSECHDKNECNNDVLLQAKGTTFRGVEGKNSPKFKSDIPIPDQGAFESCSEDSPVQFEKDDVSSKVSCPPSPSRKNSLRVHIDSSDNRDYCSSASYQHQALNGNDDDFVLSRPISFNSEDNYLRRNASLPISMQRQNSLVANKILATSDVPRSFQDEERLEKISTENNGNSQGMTSDIILSRDFINEGLIGSGTFAEVFKCTLKNGSNETFAIKKSRRQFRSKRDRADLLSEVHVMQTVGATPCPYLIRFFRAWQEDGYFYVQLDLAERGTLRDLMTKMSLSDRVISDNTVCRVLHDVASGLQHIHNCGVVHLDIKPQNILISRDGTLKIGDFGIAMAQGDDGDEGHEGDSR